MSGERQYLDRPPAVAGGAEVGGGIAPAEQWRQLEGYLEEIFAALDMPVGSPSCRSGSASSSPTR